jgi:hypothetical protein
MEVRVYTFLRRHKFDVCALIFLAIGPYAVGWMVARLGFGDLGVLLLLLLLAANALIAALALLLLMFTRGATRVFLIYIGLGAILSWAPVPSMLSREPAATSPTVFLDAFYDGTQCGQHLTFYKDGSAVYRRFGAFSFLLRDKELTDSGTYVVSNGVLYLSLSNSAMSKSPTELRLVTLPDGEMALQGVGTNGFSRQEFVVNIPTNQSWEEMGLQPSPHADVGKAE